MQQELDQILEQRRQSGWCLGCGNAAGLVLEEDVLLFPVRQDGEEQGRIHASTGDPICRPCSDSARVFARSARSQY